MSLTATTTDRIWPVGRLCQYLSATLTEQFGTIKVQGEISNWIKASSGHCYFNLKDNNGQIRCVMFARFASNLNFNPTDGTKVVLTAKIAVYEQRGDLQLIVQQLTLLGEGDLYLQFLQLKQKLQQQGLFERQNKKNIPYFPRAVAIVTSTDAAALRDVITTFNRRAPYLPIYIFNTTVQGINAPRQIIQALSEVEIFNKKHHIGIDTVLLVRGGGSIEDLWAFNDEQLAYFLSKFSLPLISGIGHETDFTITDFVADLRAPTPTAAAEIAAPPQTELQQQLTTLISQISKVINYGLDNNKQKLDNLTFYLINSSQLLKKYHLTLLNYQYKLSKIIDNLYKNKQLQLTDLENKVKLNTKNYIQQHQNNLDKIYTKLTSLNPQQVLKRGYSLVLDENGYIIKSVNNANLNQKLKVHLADGNLKVNIIEKNYL